MSMSKSQFLILILILISILSPITIDSKGGGGGRAGGVGGGSRGGGIYGGGSRGGSSSSSGSGGYGSGGRSSSGSGGSRGGGIYGGSRGGSGSSSGSGGWFKGGSKIGGGGWGMNGGKSWPKGSSSVMYGGRSMRIIPIPIFMSMGGFGYGYGNGYRHEHGYYGDRQYSQQMYKEEDGFYPCPPDIVAMHKETLNKSVDDAIKSGQFNELFLGLNSSIPTSSTFDGTSFHSSITTTPQLIDQIQSAIENYTFMCYDENRDQNNEFWNQNNENRNQNNWNIDTNYWSGDQISENMDPKEETQDQNNDYSDLLIGVVPIAVLILFLCCFCLVRRSVKISSRNANYDQDYEAVKPTAPIDSN